nr:RecName: Full=C-phycocyanin beta subunit [Limnospira fusiformis]
MFDAFTLVVSQADTRGEMLSTAQIDALSQMVAESNKYLDAVNYIT